MTFEIVYSSSHALRHICIRHVCVHVCLCTHTEAHSHTHSHIHLPLVFTHTKRTPKSQLALCMHVHDTETHNVAMSSDSHLALTCWEMAHTLLILVCGLSKLSFLPICLPGSFPCAAVEWETRKGVSDTRVYSDFCAAWLLPLGIRGLFSLQRNIPSFMCSVWHIP